MGMAASQARFLGLTARKSNVEYQGQQVNQQRTSLANESANLYNQMMALDVPVPPSKNQYYDTVYSLEGSKNTSDALADDYKVKNYTPIYDENGNSTGNYSIELSCTQNRPDGITRTYILSPIPNEEDGTKKSEALTDGKTYTKYTCNLKDATNEILTKTLFYYEGPAQADTQENMVSSLAQGMKPSQIYKIDYKEGEEATGLTPEAIPGYAAARNEWLETHTTEADKNNQTPFSHIYKDTNGKYCFLTEDEFKQLLTGTDSNDNGEDDDKYVTQYSYTEIPDTSEITVTGRIEQSDSGRLSSITIGNSENTPVNLKNKEFSITTTKVENEDAYEEAFNEYEYQKALYEQQIQEINARTEIIQKQDQKLELRLKQLETEQSAISTEMDSVKNVIKGNVEKTFNTFG